MKIAILGAGFSGLATAWHLLQQRNSQLTIFDPTGVGRGASGVAAGLMHPFAGAHSKLNKFGYEGMRASHKLFAVASQEVGAPVFSPMGTLRVALTTDQQEDYRRCAAAHERVEWCEPARCQELVPGVIAAPGIFIQDAVVVNCELYLQGLWKACQKLGARLETQAVTSLAALHEFDLIIAATGAATKSIPELAHLRITSVKGQIIELVWPEQAASLNHCLNSQVYLMKNPNSNTCIAGATYEREFSTVKPVPEVAMKSILPKLAAMYPQLDKAKVVSCSAGVRASTPDHLPICIQATDKCWVLTGMGSKGLLYHALFAEKLAAQIFFKDVGYHKR